MPPHPTLHKTVTNMRLDHFGGDLSVYEEFRQFLCLLLQSSRRSEVDPSCLKCTSEYFYKNQPQMSAVTNVTVNLNHSQLFLLPSRKLPWIWLSAMLQFIFHFRSLINLSRFNLRQIIGRSQYFIREAHVIIRKIWVEFLSSRPCFTVSSLSQHSAHLRNHKLFPGPLRPKHLATQSQNKAEIFSPGLTAHTMGRCHER